MFFFHLQKNNLKEAQKASTSLTHMAHLILVDCDAVILVILWKDIVLSKKRSLRYISYFTLSTIRTMERKKDFVAGSAMIEPNSLGQISSPTW